MRLIDGHVLMERLREQTEVITNREMVAGLLMAQGVVLEAPTIDAVEVVRCRDCKYNPWKPTANVECVWDDDWAEREQTLDDFCSYGVREDDEE